MSSQKKMPTSPTRRGKRSIEELEQDVKIAHGIVAKQKTYPLPEHDHDAVVCFFLELFDLSELDRDHWEEARYQEFKSKIRDKWGGMDQTPDNSFSVMFRRGYDILEERFPREVARLRDAGLEVHFPKYDDFKTTYPTEDDHRDKRDGSYYCKALLCFFMEMFDAQHHDNPATHWTEGLYDDLKGSIEPSWVKDGVPNPKFDRMTRRGLEIVENTFPETFKHLREHDMI